MGQEGSFSSMDRGGWVRCPFHLDFLYSSNVREMDLEVQWRQGSVYDIDDFRSCAIVQDNSFSIIDRGRSPVRCLSTVTLLHRTTL